MKGTCSVCGKEYPIKSFQEDVGLCAEHKPAFLSLSILFAPTPARTRALWQYVAGIHVLYLVILFGGLASLYALTVLIYLVIRFVMATIKGYPILTKRQAACLWLLPIYGPVGFVTLFHVVQWLK